MLIVLAFNLVLFGIMIVGSAQKYVITYGNEQTSYFWYGMAMLAYFVANMYALTVAIR